MINPSAPWLCPSCGKVYHTQADRIKHQLSQAVVAKTWAEYRAWLKERLEAK